MSTLELVYTAIPDGFTLVLPITGGTITSINWGPQTLTDGVTVYVYDPAPTSPTTVSITGTGFALNYSLGSATGQEYLTSCTSFGSGVVNVAYAFFNCANLTLVPATLPGVCTDLGSMFQGCTSFNSPNVSSWVTTNVTNMEYMFAIFGDTPSSAFNQPLNTWDTSSVTSMGSMFLGATSFNQSLSNWNTSFVTAMQSMFNNAILFNQPLSTSGNLWNVSSVGSFENMFNNATAFNQDISSWQLAAANNMFGFLSGSGLSYTNYNALLDGWAAYALLNPSTFPTGIIMDASLLYSTAGQAGRNVLISAPYNWTIQYDSFQEPATITPNVPFSLAFNTNANFTVGNTFGLFLDNPTSPTPPTSPFSSEVILASSPLTFTGLTTSVSGRLTVYLFDVTSTSLMGTYNIYTETPPCFKEGSKILTDKGYLAIETLRKGDLVKTLKHGFVPINMIGKRVINNPAVKDRVKEQLYKCSQEQYPEVFEDLIITGCHSILVGNTITHKQIEQIKEVLGNIYVTDDKYRLPACVDDRTSVYEVEGDFTIYHIALDNDDYYMNYGVYANGLLVETCSKRYLKELSKMDLI